MVMNRIADVFSIIAILILIVRIKTTDYLICSEIIPYIVSEHITICMIEFKPISAIAFSPAIGAFGKSAQIGFHT
jgi:NADH:ubiquinone oxidoreductase subunit 5 (subunit L)/multisubunit Na+/H+ antiporter MnhA subunit